MFLGDLLINWPVNGSVMAPVSMVQSIVTELNK
jgi:hypothetical protein